MSGQAPPAIRRPASERIHEAPPKPVDVLLDDARFHLANAIRCLDLARHALKGDAAYVVRQRMRAVRRECQRIELFMSRHRMPVRALSKGGPAR